MKRKRNYQTYFQLRFEQNHTTLERQLIAALLFICLGGCCSMGESNFKESAFTPTQPKMSMVDAEKYMHSEGFDCYHGADTHVVSCRRSKSCLTMFGMLFQGTCAENVNLILTPDLRAVDRAENQPKQCFGL
jgi:hypothetical protein